MADAGLTPRADVRHGVRALLSDQQGFATLDPETRRDLARGLVRIGAAAVANDEVARPALAQAQGNAGSEFSGVATRRLAQTTRDTLNAVSFPRFVTELITGVFKAMNDSNQQQLTAFVDLIKNVSQTTEGFADANVGLSGARQWLADRFPTNYEIRGGEDEGIPEDLSGLSPDERRQREAEIQAERDAATEIVLKAGASPPSDAALRAALGLPATETVSGGNPEGLLPLVRQTLARNRQQLLGTMIQMGLQRIVIESGRLNASMRFHIDTSSAATNDRGSQFDMRNTTEVGVGAKFGPWGAEAKMQNTIGYVSTDRTQTNEQMNTSVDLDSSVELVFRTDYVPLAHLAGVAEAERIRVNTINPDAESQRYSEERRARDTARATDNTNRATRMDASLRTPPAPTTGPTIDTSRLSGSGGGASAAAPAARPASPPVAASPGAAPVAAAPGSAAPAAPPAAPAVSTPAPAAR